MADDRMKNDDLQRNMGGTRGEEGHDVGQHSPGRSGQGGQQGGQHAGGQKGGYGGQNARDMEEDDDLGAGGAGKTGTPNRGGQNR